MKDIYNDGKYLEHNPNWHQEDSGYKAEKVMSILKDNNIKFETLAEIGCGAGEILKILSENYKQVEVYGYDISSDAIKIANRKETKNLKFYHKDLLATDRRFDVLLMMDVFEHVRDYMGFIEKASTHSNYMVFHIPLDMSVHKILFPSKLIRNRKEVGHLHYFTRETALETLKDCGLEILDQRYTRWGLETKQKNTLKQIGKLPLFLLDIFSTDLAAKILGGNSLIVLTKRK